VALGQKEDILVAVIDKDYHWCTCNHGSGGVKHNSMYTDHISNNHDIWRKSIDNCCAAHTPAKSSNESFTPAATAPVQKLALNNKH
jgi:hypothetical protein